MDVMTRLLWKEFRTQAQLWLAMLIGVFLLTLTFVLTSGPSIPSTGLSDILIGVIYVLTAGFAAASAAVLFAGESEDGQADWLRQLPMSTSQLINSKVGFGALATALLFAASCLVATIAIRWSRGDWLSPQFVPARSSLLCIAGCFVWGVFYSALMSRVLAVIVSAAFTTILLQAVLNQTIGNVLVCDVVHACMLLMVALVGRAQLWVWHRKEVVSQREISISPRTGNSLGSIPLKWLVTVGPLEVRRWTVLIWKEVCAAIPMVIGTVLTLAAMNWATNGHALAVLLPAAIVLFGLRTFRSEHRENTISFLSDRGVPGGRVWLVKVPIWLTSAALAVVCCLIWEQVSIRWGLTRRTDVTFTELIDDYIPYYRLDRSHLAPSLRMAREHDIVATIWSLGMGLFVGLFAIGQMASFWLRRAILAFAASFVGGVLFIIWALKATSIDIPLGASIWPAAVLFLVATWDTRRFWMEQRTGWPVRRRQVLWIVFPVVLCVSLALLSRGWQVPAKDPGFDWRAYSSGLDGIDPQWTNRWQAEWLRPEYGGETLAKLVEESAPDRRIDPLLMATVTGSERAIPVTRLIENFEAGYQTGARALAQSPLKGDVEHRQKLLKQQLDWIKTSLKGVRYLASQTSCWTDFEICLQTEKRLLSRIRAWSAADNQTVEMLDEALQWLQEDTAASEKSNVVESFREMVRRRYVVLRGLFTGEGRIGTAIETQLLVRGRHPDWFVSSILGTPERDRLLNLLAWATDAELKMPLASFPTLQHAQFRPSAWGSTEFDYDRYASTTPWLPAELQDGAAIGTSEMGQSIQQLMMLHILRCRAISVVAVALQRHRLMHGEFPKELAELTDSPVTIPLDPMWDRPFVYTRADDPENALKSVGRFIRGQPLLKSAVEQPIALNSYDEWETRMKLQPDRVLVVLPFGESLQTANDNWPQRPEPEPPAVPLYGGESGGMMMEGPMMGTPRPLIMPPARPKPAQPPVPPFDV